MALPVRRDPVIVRAEAGLISSRVEQEHYPFFHSRIDSTTTKFIQRAIQLTSEAISPNDCKKFSPKRVYATLKCLEKCQPVKAHRPFFPFAEINTIEAALEVLKREIDLLMNLESHCESLRDDLADLRTLTNLLENDRENPQVTDLIERLELADPSLENIQKMIKRYHIRFLLNTLWLANILDVEWKKGTVPEETEEHISYIDEIAKRLMHRETNLRADLPHESMGDLHYRV